MQAGIIGLGKMGFGIAERLLEQKFDLAANDIDFEALKRITIKGAVGIQPSSELMHYLARTRMVLASVPEKSMDSIVEEAYQHMSGGDILVDLSNSFYKDSQRRAAYLKQRWIWLLDAGISGGISAARWGACLMVGGERDAVIQADPLLKALSKDGKYAYLGPSGAGHLVKGYHNLVEYGYLQALAEGLSCIAGVSAKEAMGINVADVCDIWNNGSIVESRITHDAYQALARDSKLDGISGSVKGQTLQEMRKLLGVADLLDIGMPCCSAAVEERIMSRIYPSYQGKIINAIRKVFGGHEEWNHVK